MSIQNVLEAQIPAAQCTIFSKRKFSCNLCILHGDVFQSNPETEMGTKLSSWVGLWKNSKRLYPTSAKSIALAFSLFPCEMQMLFMSTLKPYI